MTSHTWKLDPEIGDAVLWAITQSQVWHHRKVESLRLVDGPQSVRRVSIDLTVPSDERLIVTADVAGAQGEILVPLAMVQKTHLQSFDARHAGQSLPIASTDLDGEVMVAAISRSWELDIGHPVDDVSREAVRALVFAPPQGAWVSVQTFLETGRLGDFAVDVSGMKSLTVGLVETASLNFLLAGLLPISAAGTHTVLKYQTHWELVSVRNEERVDAGDRYLSSLGWDSAPLEIELNDAGLVPASFHLEVQTPAALFSDRLELFQDGESIGVDPRSTVVAHVVSHPKGTLSLPDSAIVHLRASPFGLLPWATAFALLTAVFLWMSFLTPVLERLFDPEARVGGPVFLSALALLIGIVTRTSENPLAGKVLGPLRLTVAAMALMYFVLAVAIVVAVPMFLAKATWLAFAVSESIVAVLLVVGFFQCRRAAIRRV